MGCIVSGEVIATGNFAELQPEPPRDFDYMTDAKWLEDYPFDKRECIGGTICSCKKVRVHFSPYYGWDHYHLETCNLMRKLNDQPRLAILWAFDHLPAIAFSKKAVPADSRIPQYIKIQSKSYRIKVNIVRSPATLPLFAGVLTNKSRV